MGASQRLACSSGSAALLDAGARAHSPRVQVSEMQRARLLGATVAVVEERGYAHTTVAHITARARISRRTFYDMFENREDCLLAVVEEGVERVTRALRAAQLERLPWRERIRSGLWTILCLFDQDPALARLCVVHALRGGPTILRRREQLLTDLVAIVDEGRAEGPRAGACPPLTAEGVVGAALSILYTRLLNEERGALSELLGELMSMIVLPYLGVATARRERTRPLPALVPRLPEETLVAPNVAESALRRLPSRMTYRTARVLEEIAAHPGISNREVAARVGIADQGQVSKLLARLQRLALLENTGVGHTKGEPNAWQLTKTGHKLTRTIRNDARDSGQAQHRGAAPLSLRGGDGI